MDEKPQTHTDPEEENYLTLRQAAELLEISEEELRGLVQTRQISTHNLAGAFLRLKKDEVEALKNRWRIERELFPKRERWFVHRPAVERATFAEKWKDFWYFNDFYILCSVLIVLLLYFIISSQ